MAIVPGDDPKLTHPQTSHASHSQQYDGNRPENSAKIGRPMEANFTRVDLEGM